MMPPSPARAGAGHVGQGLDAGPTTEFRSGKAARSFSADRVTSAGRRQFRDRTRWAMAVEDQHQQHPVSRHAEQLCRGPSAP